MYDNELITKNNERVVSFLASIDRMLDGIENMVCNCKPTLGGERYLTDKEVSAKLRVSRRTLQDYRNEGLQIMVETGELSPEPLMYLVPEPHLPQHPFTIPPPYPIVAFSK